MKYMGSKARLMKHLAPIMTAARSSEQAYVEPFVGGGNAIVHMSGRRMGNDSNRYVVALLSRLAEGWVPEHVTKEKYQLLKANPSAYPYHLVGWAGIGCSYSGKWFGGYAGVVNTRQGVRDYQAEARENVLKQAPLLAGIEFSAGEYDTMHIPPSSLVYCDPPYRGTTKYADEFDSDKFWEWCDSLVADGHTVFVSEYSSPSDWDCIWERPVSSSLSANGKSGGNKTSVERLFTRKAIK